MPKNDSQPNDSQPDGLENRIELLRNVHIAKRAFVQVARQYKGTVRHARQHTMIWSGLGSAFSRKKWQGVCGPLAAEWVKEHVMGGDLIKKIVRLTNVLSHGLKCDKKDAAFISRLCPDPKITFELALRNFCKYQNWYVFYFPFVSSIHYAFKRCQYQIILSEDHAMASCVDENGEMVFYDPSIGQASGLSSIGFVQSYFTRIYEIGLEERGLTQLPAKERIRVEVLGFAPLGNRLRRVHRRLTI